MKKNIQYFLALLLLLLTGFPLILERFPYLYKDKPLMGSFINTDKPNFQISELTSGNFQTKYEAYLNNSMKCRSLFIRLRNQLDFSFFNKTHTADIKKCNDGFLQAELEFDYDLGKLRSYSGAISADTDWLKFLQDTLAKKNILLAVLLAPTKASYFSEKRPLNYTYFKADSSDYDMYVANCKSKGVNIIDFDNYFLQLKSTYDRKLFSKFGAHWTCFGTVLAMDSIIKYIESKKGIEMMHFEIKNLNPSTEIKYCDHDLLNTLNLFYEPETDTLYYPDLKYNESNGKSLPNVLVVSDSYQEPVNYVGIPQRVYGEYGFWYYYKSYHDKKTGVRRAKKIDLKKEVESKDVIFLMATKANLGNLGWGFIRDLYQIYSGHTFTLGEMYADKIKHSPQWVNSIREKAITNKITIAEMIKLDGEYMAGLDIENRCAEIKKNKQLLLRVIKKAKDNNISLDQMIKKEGELMAIEGMK